MNRNPKLKKKNKTKQKPLDPALSNPEQGSLGLTVPNQILNHTSQVPIQVLVKICCQEQNPKRLIWISNSSVGSSINEVSISFY